MEELKHQHFRESVRSFMLLNPTAPTNDIVNHFKKQGMKKSAIYNYIKRIKDGWDLKKKQGGGNPQAVLTPKIREKLVMMFDGETDVSVNHAARKFKVSWKVVNKWLKEMGIQRKARKKIPFSDEKQKQKQKTIFNKIARDEFRADKDLIDVVMDDETYLDFNGHDFSGNRYYFTSGLLPVDDEKKYRPKTKFPQKLLVWVAISRKGHSQVYFRSQKQGAINAIVYKDECIKKRLIPFIKRNYPNDDYIFWPDLASSHYANSVTELLREQNIKFLAKDRNPPNVPQVRPIEKFWSHLKREVFKDGFKPKTIDELEQKAKKAFKTFDREYFEGLMKSVPRKVRAAAARGPLSVIN